MVARVYSRLAGGDVSVGGSASMETGGFGEVTRENYRHIARTLRERGIRFFAMQYPLQAPEPLASIFPPEWRVPVIRNDRNFREALRERPYGALFQDRFAGSFGHCSKDGYTLIAHEVVRRLLQEGVLPDP